MIHFGNKNQSFSQAPWFTSLGLTYTTYNTSKSFGEDIFTNLRLGRDFNLNTWLNFGFSIGIGINVYHYYNSSGWGIDIHFPVIPSGQLSIAFKIASFGKES